MASSAYTFYVPTRYELTAFQRVVDYTGKDLDKYESDFINDEAEESGDDKEADKGSGDESDREEEGGLIESEDEGETGAEVSKADVGEVSEEELEAESDRCKSRSLRLVRASLGLRLEHRRWNRSACLGSMIES